MDFEMAEAAVPMAAVGGAAPPPEPEEIVTRKNFPETFIWADEKTRSLLRLVRSFGVPLGVPTVIPRLLPL